MAGPLDFDDDMQRMLRRKGEATANGGHAYQLLLRLAERRDFDRPRLYHRELAVVLLEAQARIKVAALSRLAQ